jgi:hypothetical protein
MSSIPTPVKSPKTSRSDALMDSLPELLGRKMHLETYPSPISVDKAWKACTNGDHFTVQTFLYETDSPKSLTDKVDENGFTVLHRASEVNPSGTVKILELLLEYGANVNAQDIHGDTALMRACTHVQLENVVVLLNNNADTRIENHSQKTAYVIARYRFVVHPRTLARQRLSPEQRKTKDMHRVVILYKLHPTKIVEKPVLQILSKDTAPYSYSREKSDASLRSFIFPVDLENSLPKTVPKTFWVSENNWNPQNKAVACLRAHGLSPQYAMSGYNHAAIDDTIAGNYWTYMAVGIAGTIGYNFKTNMKCDQNWPGRFNASHTEPQLMAWYLIELNYPIGEMFTSSIQIHPARNHPVEISIIVNREICPECRRFQTAVNKRTTKYYGFRFDIVGACQNI